jgi:hypothetical protein
MRHYLFLTQHSNGIELLKQERIRPTQGDAGDAETEAQEEMEIVFENDIEDENDLIDVE